MNAQTHDMLEHIGFDEIGEDPDARDYHLYHIDLTSICISVPEAGCSPKDLVKLIWHAGAAAARREIRTAREAYLRALAA
jgi:hypothetical protein